MSSRTLAAGAVAFQCFLNGCQSPHRQATPPQPSRIVVLTEDPDLLHFPQIEWSPSSEKLIVCDHSAQGRLPRIYILRSGNWTALPIDAIITSLPGLPDNPPNPPTPRNQFQVRQALWRTESELIVTVGRRQTSNPEDATHVYLMDTRGTYARRIATTTDEVGVSISPYRTQLGIYDGYESPFSWGTIIDCGYWSWVKPSSTRLDAAVAVGSFGVQLGSREILPPRQARDYLWSVGGIDFTELRAAIGRPVADAQYLPKARRIGFRITPMIADNLSDEWYRYWESGPIKLGTASVGRADLRTHVIRIPSDLEFWSLGLGIPARQCKVVWSVDGKYVLVRHKRRNELWAIDVSSGRATRVARELPGWPFDLFPSPDGRKLVLSYGERDSYGDSSGNPKGLLLLVLE